jgi:hypothetical protein
MRRRAAGLDRAQPREENMGDFPQRVNGRCYLPHICVLVSCIGTSNLRKFLQLSRVLPGQFLFIKIAKSAGVLRCARSVDFRHERGDANGH